MCERARLSIPDCMWEQSDSDRVDENMHSCGSIACDQLYEDGCSAQR